MYVELLPGDKVTVTGTTPGDELAVGMEGTVVEDQFTGPITGCWLIVVDFPEAGGWVGVQPKNLKKETS